jgi:hypothetical protein
MMKDCICDGERVGEGKCDVNKERRELKGMWQQISVRVKRVWGKGKK